jgi:murein DD-endopeptidase MepM/ murein hydrolase activator NlpD
VVRLIVVVVAAVAVLGGGVVYWRMFDTQTPQVVLEQPLSAVGRQANIDLIIKARGNPGLRETTVDLVSGGNRHTLLHEDYPAGGFLGGGTTERKLHVEADLSVLSVPEGPAQLEVSAATHAWHILPPHPEPVLVHPLNVDLTPPGVELLTTQHNLRLGGAGLVVARLTADGVDASIEVEQYRFPVTRGYFADKNVVLGMFAVPQEIPPTSRPRIRVADEVGNVRTVEIPSRIRTWPFADRTIPIDDQFLQRKVPDLLARNGMPPQTDLVQGYLEINRSLRRASEEKLKAITAKSLPQPLWDGAFNRQSNAAPMSGFADRRTYMYGGQPIDHQVHLGFDLASTLRAPIEATQDGIVVFADNLGIYGNTVVLDHGLGVFSLYGHLSSIGVKPEQRVRMKEHLGQSGDTGLAGGDHIHFSIMIYGTHVDPREWWDGKWIRDHVTSALNLLPSAQAAAAAAALQTAPAAESAPATPAHD